MDLACTPEIITKIDCLLFFFECHAEILKTFETPLKARKIGFEENYNRRNFMKSTALKCCEKQKRLRHFVVISITSSYCLILLGFLLILSEKRLRQHHLMKTSFDPLFRMADADNSTSIIPSCTCISIMGF